MRKVAAREKRYVEVESRTDEDGNVTPLTIIWSDVARCPIDRVLDCRQACSLKTGGTGMRYTIKVNGKSTYLFYEGPGGSWRQRWCLCHRGGPLGGKHLNIGQKHATSHGHRAAT